MSLDEATSGILARMAEAGTPPLHEMSPEEARAFVATMSPDLGEGPEMAAIQNRRVPVTGGAVAVRLLIPRGEHDGLILYLHGGGWVVGSIDDSELLGRRLADRTKCIVALVEYRLAPEYRFPTAVDDCLAVLRWVDRDMEALVGGRVPVIVAGDSAGGNLAAVMTLKARDAKGPKIAMQVLVYPVTDCDFDSVSYRDPENALMLTREAMGWFWDHYAPDPIGRAHPDASPVRAPDLSNLPPAVVLTAEHDVLRSEGEVYATRLLKSGVPVQHHRFKGQMHGFFTMVDVLPGSEAGINYVVDALRRQLTLGRDDLRMSV